MSIQVVITVEMGRKHQRIGRVRINVEIENDLINRTDLHIVAGFKLIVVQMVVIHAHKGGIGIGLAATVSAIHDLIFCLVFI
ncbi:MAG: hypothetical protein AMXMBFR68_09960 [Ignavibacteria bacterium]|nr:MAG: hypothetical protein F9K28_04615 [Bacteroidota bacterium]MBW7852719.1 hypothetical protein [Candidatus Kapabacteria bacterium]MBZ0193725.1 hypothetical protein [Candidatus Kapabacteria bacterium]NOG68121.1 hypothetical protein [Chlorobiota bacterium]